MEQGSLKKTQTPGPRPRRAHINLDRIRISALEIWAGPVIPLVGPIGRSPPAIQFLRAWPMTWDFGSGTLSYPVSRRHLAGGIDWSYKD